MRAIFSTRRMSLHSRRNQFGASLGGPIKKNRLFLFGNYEGFRQALSLTNVSIVPDLPARQGLLPNASGVLAPVPNLNTAMLPYTAFWPVPNGPELLANGVPTGTALAYNNHPSNPFREDFGTLRADLRHQAIRDYAFGVTHTLDDGNNLTPLADPLFGSYETLRSQVASVRETHIFSPRILNTFTAGFSRAAFNYDSFSLVPFPHSLDFVTGLGAGGIVVGGGMTTTGAAAITAAGPNNAANVWNRRNLFYLH